MTPIANHSAPALHLRYSASADALYVQLREGQVAETIEVEEMVYVDVDQDGRPLGIEFVVASDLFGFLGRHGGAFTLPQRITDPAALRVSVETVSAR